MRANAGLLGIRGVVRAVKFSRMCAGSLLQVADFRNAELHARGEFVARNAGREFAVAGMLLEVAGIHALEQRARRAVGILLETPGAVRWRTGSIELISGALERARAKSQALQLFEPA